MYTAFRRVRSIAIITLCGVKLGKTTPSDTRSNGQQEAVSQMNCYESALRKCRRMPREETVTDLNSLTKVRP